MTAQRFVGVTCLAIIATTCGGQGIGTENGVLVRDSAGVTIVENRTPLMPEGAGWRLADGPALQIGSIDDADESLARVTSARTLSDGRIAVFDAGYHQIRVFGPDGGFIGSIGREGDGPGGFTAGVLDRLARDTLLVFDFFGGRVTLFDERGDLAGTVQLRPPDPGGGFSYLTGLGGGSYLTRGGTNPMYLGEGSGLIRGAGWISRLDPQGTSLGKVVEFRSGEGLVLGGGRGYMGVPFARRHFALADADRIVLGFADRFPDVVIADDLRLLEIARAHVLAVWRDELDVQYLRRYAPLK